MLLILTHENSDFDAVASQLAAQKLYPDGIPLLSWRINRNVEQFLSLYWDVFPFQRPDDWQRQRVSRVVLVDTLALPSVRGLRPDRIKVQVIDHHELGEEINPEWSYRTEPVGATTTILVEMLQEGGHSLNVNEATLLLLGVHEDTGSLVYDTTTRRDAQAVAWLLQQGAQLSVVRRFLNIPLSEQQQALYDRLQESAEWMRVEGQAIVVSAVVAPEGFDDEISAVAHRLRDAVMPDGLFLLVQLKYNHVQLVARSSTDHVDVAIVARALGGGGHSRAAAATIMDAELDQVRRKVIDLIPDIVTPMAKVAQIMSYGVQTIPSSARIKDAAELMLRSGHEGYPVVDPNTDQLVGLLSRRMVDRAINHQLGDLAVDQIMRAGNVTVQPTDSVEKLQRLMIEEGWSQIPVSAGNSTNIDQANILIGIVTRTDLINLLTNTSHKKSEPDMRKLMIESLPDALWEMVQVVSKVAGSLEMPVYFVGGLVRDMLLKKASKDIDLVVEGDAIHLVKQLRTRYGGEIRSHRQFGTAKWLLSPQVWEQLAPGTSIDDLPMVIDFVTARTEFYDQPTVLPEVERGSIKLDLHRRDFSINTLAVRLDGAHLGNLLDFYGGLRDLDLGLIRVLHSLSFVDDPTRILRAVRLEQRLDFTIEARTSELIAAALPMLNRITGDRIRHEIEMCLNEGKRIPIMARLAKIGILAEIHPGLTWHEQTAERYARASNILVDPFWKGLLGDDSPAFVFFCLLLLPLTNTVQEETMTRLKVRKVTRDDVVAAQQLIHQLGQLSENDAPSRIVSLLRPYPDRTMLVALVVYGLNSLAGRSIRQYQETWRYIRPILNGSDLLELGFEAGPRIGKQLRMLQAAHLDGIVHDIAGELALLNSEIENHDRETKGENTQ